MLPGTPGLYSRVLAGVRVQIWNLERHNAWRNVRYKYTEYQEDASTYSKSASRTHHQADTDPEKFNPLENTHRISFRDKIGGAQLKQPPCKKKKKTEINT